MKIAHVQREDVALGWPATLAKMNELLTELAMRREPVEHTRFYYGMVMYAVRSLLSELNTGVLTRDGQYAAGGSMKDWLTAHGFHSKPPPGW